MYISGDVVVFSVLTFFGCFHPVVRIVVLPVAACLALVKSRSWSIFLSTALTSACRSLCWSPCHQRFPAMYRTCLPVVFHLIRGLHLQALVQLQYGGAPSRCTGIEIARHQRQAFFDLLAPAGVFAGVFRIASGVLQLALSVCPLTWLPTLLRYATHDRTMAFIPAISNNSTISTALCVT